MFSPTACWQAGQVFIAAKVFSTGVDVKRSATSAHQAVPHSGKWLWYCFCRCERPNPGNEVAKKDKPDRDFAVGDKLKIKLQGGES
jgi:hypothetical protein